LAFGAPPVQSAFVSHAAPAFGPSTQRFTKQLPPGQSESAVQLAPAFAPPMHLLDGHPSFAGCVNVFARPSSHGVPFGSAAGVWQKEATGSHRLGLHGSPE
jgi:hypothetical protein